MTLGSSYIGCDYFPTVTANPVSTRFDFAVAIANTTTSSTTVTIEGGALTAPQFVDVPASSVVVQKLPWQPALKFCNSQFGESGCPPGQPGALAPKGAYHLRSTVPVTVYQFNSLQYEANSEFSFSNDASLLLPTNVWRTKYFAAAFDPLPRGYPSQLAVTAMRDHTTVTINAKASTLAGQGAPAFSAGIGQSVVLDTGDVIEISSASGDLTGSLVESDGPVEVIGGHYCANVPQDIMACDHLEESMFPVDALGQRYIINAPFMSIYPRGKVEVIRVVATAPNTTLTYDPPQEDAPTTIAQAGDFVEIRGNWHSFQITGDQKILVVQYMEGQDVSPPGTGDTGDPAMTLAVPVEQFRKDYLFHAPLSYEASYVDVTAPSGSQITLDGVQLSFTPIGITGFAVARTQLQAGPAGDGNHKIEGNKPFGITVYGYGRFTSYWYPGGLNLNAILL
jgi:hypothetical protein